VDVPVLKLNVFLHCKHTDFSFVVVGFVKKFQTGEALGFSASSGALVFKASTSASVTILILFIL
jgi:hypothetical protein